MKMDHNFIEHQLLEIGASRPRRRDSKGQVALVMAALLAAALAVAGVPDPHPAATAQIMDVA